MRVAGLVLSILAAAVGAAAQSVHWDPPGGTLAVGQTAPLQLVFADCDSKEAPVPPGVDGLRLEYAGRSTNVAMINGGYAHTANYTFAALLLQPAPVTIPAFVVETDKGAITVAAVRFAPTAAIVGASGRSLESVARSAIAVAATSVWTGQVFDLNYQIEADSSYFPDIGHGQFEWNSAPLIAEDWTGPAPFNRTGGGGPWLGFGYHTRAVAASPGTFTLHPARQFIHLSVGVFGFFQQRQYEPFSVTSTAPVLEVRPLPPAPPGFAGAVGHFRLAAKLIPATAAVGEPITWTLELNGTGNWPQIAGLPARAVSRDFQVVRPQTKRAPTAGKIFDATLSEDAVLVPTKPGRYTLPAVDFIFFDPATAAYQTASTAPVELVISSAAGARHGSADSTESSPRTLLVAPELPSGLPGDAMPIGAVEAGPLDWIDLLGDWAAALILVAAGWLGLALRRARITDARRPEREARERLCAALARMRAAPSDPSHGPAIRPDLVSWQQESARIWTLRPAAPRPQHFSDEEWHRLWAEAEDALYGPETVLPSDWLARADRAVQAKPTPPFAARQLFLRRNLFPFLILTLALAGGARAESPTAAYQRGDFAAAETAWRSARPRDAAARYDLSLALSQQHRWPEAVAEAAAAFVQRPSDPAIRRQFALACEEAGVSPGPLAAFIHPGWGHRFAQLASPAQWQRRLLDAGWLTAAGCLVLLAAGYGLVRARRQVSLIGGGLVGLAAVLAAISALSWAAYGPAAYADAAFLWRAGTLRSIPTEADTTQTTVTVGAGLIGAEDRAFLGWVRLTFPNGESGWVRRSDVVPLWK
jgi:hypothetical protein